MAREIDEEDGYGVEVERGTRKGTRKSYRVVWKQRLQTFGITAVMIIIITAIAGYPVTMWPGMIRDAQKGTKPQTSQAAPKIQPPAAQVNQPVKPADVQPQGSGAGFGMLSGGAVNTDLIVAQELQAKIKEVPSLLGGLTLPETETVVGEHHKKMVDAYFKLDGETKVKVFNDEAWWLTNAVKLDNSAQARAAITDIVIAFDATARNGLNADGINWIANSIRGISAFGDFEIEWNGVPTQATQIAQTLEDDALKALKQEAADKAAKAEQARQAALKAAEDAKTAANQPATGDVTAPNAGNVTAPDNGLAPSDVKVPDPVGQLGKVPAPQGQLVYQPDTKVVDVTGEYTANDVTDVVPPQVVAAPNNTMGFGWSAAPIMWTIREVWNVMTGQATWQDMPGTRDWYVLEEFVIYKGEVLGFPFEVHSVFIGETKDTLSEELKHNGLPSLNALRNDISFGTDTKGHRWANLVTVLHLPRPVKEGENITWMELSGILADFMKK